MPSVVATCTQDPAPDGWIGHWSPGIGDPSPVGWLTVAAYFTAAWLALRAARRAREVEAEPERARRIWLLLAVGFLLLGVNKQLDLQSAVTEIGRILAREQGWYDDRRAVQLAFAAVVAAAGATALGALLWFARRSLGRMKEALAGAALVVTYVLIRAASFHRVDQFIHARVLGVKWNWILELTGIAVAAHGAWRYARLGRPAAD